MHCEGPSGVRWGAAMSTFMLYRVPAIPSNPLNVPGHSSGLYKSILTAKGLSISPLFRGQPTHLPGPHTGYPSRHKSQRPTIIAPPFQLTNCHSHLVFPLPSQLEQTTIIMEAWLLQFQASQKRLVNILKKGRCNQGGKITKFLISCTHGHCPENHLIK